MKSRFSKHRSWSGLVFLILALQPIVVAQEVADQSNQAHYRVLHTFSGGADGSGPGTMILDAQGNLFGTTSGGGDLSCNQGSGCGVVFKLDPIGKETVLYKFVGGSDGEFPNSGLAADGAGHLYGTTFYGGRGTCTFGVGCGTVFQVDETTGAERVLYRFSGGADGANPLYATVTRDAAGNLYGTTGYGGTSAGGNVFKLEPAGEEIVLYSFTGRSGDGSVPSARLIRDRAGNLYGTTVVGGNDACDSAGCGIAFKLDPAGRETVLHRFTGGSDGGIPTAELVQDAAGNLYGTTASGGSAPCACGTVFKVDKSGNQTVLHSFTGGVDGTGPSAGLILDPAGNLYGTAFTGGSTGCFGGGCGTVFKLETTGKLIVLHTFKGGADGAGPASTLVRDAAGNLYGAAGAVVFKLTP
jgi:uncharacterized repeat protein (TIGR03803 family)